MTEIYLDNSATTRCLDSVANIVAKVMCEDYGNPSSMHMKGVQAENYVKMAKNVIARNLKVNEKEIYFTSGGTESDNLAIIGAAMANHRAGNHLITTCIEHPAVLRTMEYLETQGFQVTYLPVDEFGRVRLQELENALTPNTILVSIMHTNNEIGALQPIAEAGNIIKRYNPNIVFHVDAVQGYGKFRIFPKKMGVDMMSVSGHKIHGPKGIGFLYINEKVKIKPISYGGGQQKGMRSGTDNVPGAAGLGVAAREMYYDFDKKADDLYHIKDTFIRRLGEVEGTRVNGLTGRDSAPHVVSVSFDGVRSEVLLHALEDKGVYVSSGSACSSNHPAVSGTLKAIDVKKE